MHDFSNPNATHKQLKRLHAKIVRLKNQYARMRTLERKHDTRQKIQLGGLVKKAGLEGEPTAIILGLLLEAAEKLKTEQADKLRGQWRTRGDLALTFEQTSKT